MIWLNLQWVVQGAVDVDIGANPSAEGGGEDEGVDDQTVKVVDIVDTFRLQVYELHLFSWFIAEFFWYSSSKKLRLFDLQEQPAFDKKQFVTFMKRYIKNLTPKLEPEMQESFKKNIEGATKFLLSKIKDFQLYVTLVYLLGLSVINMI